MDGLHPGTQVCFLCTRCSLQAIHEGTFLPLTILDVAAARSGNRRLAAGLAVAVAVAVGVHRKIRLGHLIQCQGGTREDYSWLQKFWPEHKAGV